MRRYKRKIPESVVCLCLLALLALMALSPIAGGKVPATGDDGYAFLSDTVRRGDSLLWNPLEYAGLPFFATWRSRCLSPFTIPFYLCSSLPLALQLSALLKVLAAGVCAFYAARKLGLQWATAFLAAAAFEVGSPILVGLDNPLSDVVPWTPLLFVFAERLAIGQFRYWPLGALTGFLMLAGGAGPAVAAALLCFAFYLAVRLCLKREARRMTSALPVLFSSMGLAVALAAVQVVPYLELMRQSVTSGAETGVKDSFGGLGLLFFPQLFDGQNPSNDMRAFALMHLGLIQILLAALWCSLRHCDPPQHRQRVDALLITSAAALLCALSLQPLAERLPLIGLFEAEHIGVACILVLAFAGAETAEAWLALNPEQCISAMKRMVVATTVLFFVVISAFVVTSTHYYGAPNWPLQLVLGGFLVLAFFLLLGTTLLRPSPRLIGYGLASLTALDLLTAFHPYIEYSEKGPLPRDAAFVQAMKDSGQRIGGGNGLQEWPLAENGIPQAFGTGDLMLKRYAALAERSMANPEFLSRAGCNVLLLSKQDILGSFADLRSSLVLRQVSATGAALFENLDGAERAWVACEGREVVDFDPNLLDANLPPLFESSTPLPLSQCDRDASSAEVTSSSNILIGIRANLTGPGVLVLADAFYPGWKATVDGGPAEIFPVDGAFRGVALAQGEHDVEFRYDPASVKAGLAVSAAAALITAVGLAGLLRRKLRDRREQF